MIEACPADIFKAEEYWHCVTLGIVGIPDFYEYQHAVDNCIVWCDNYESDGQWIRAFDKFYFEKSEDAIVCELIKGKFK